MSYAQVTAKNADQPDEEKVPHAVPEIAHSDSGVHSLDSISIGSGSSTANKVPSYAEQGLESERNARAREEAEQAADDAAEAARDFSKQADAELSRLEKEAGKKYNDFSQDAKNSYDAWKKEAQRDYDRMKKEAKKGGKEAKEEAKKSAEWADKNKQNPVVVGNTVVIAALAGLLGVGAYRLHQRNELTWKVAGAWAGVVGLFAVGDYYVSQWFFKNKYPPKN